jgi:hypothetical protein
VVRKDNEGRRRVAFQTGIDYLRAASEETARYVGQKPIIFGPDIDQGTGEGTIKVPEYATATVLRRDAESGEVVEIPHTVYWREYYPGEKMGFMWRKMPHSQLGKCAEAGALRKGFPRKLGGLYVNEEMEQAAAVPFAAKAPVGQPAEVKQQPQGKTEGNTVTGVYDAVTKKSGGTKDKPWTKFAVNVDGVWYSTFDTKIAELLEANKDKKVTLTFSNDGKYNTIGEVSLPSDTPPAEDFVQPADCPGNPFDCGHSAFNEKDEAICNGHQKCPK